MSIFQQNKVHIEQQMLVKLMSKLEDDPLVSQRHLATELGIALGLMNTYLKRCIKKGWVRMSQVPAKRIAYYLTAEGFKEKGHMVKNYIADSLSFFRDARFQCEQCFAECLQKGWQRIAIVGTGDLAEIARLVAQGVPIKIEPVLLSQPIAPSEYDLFEQYDAVLITDIQDPQQIYDQLIRWVAKEKLLLLDVLHISRQTKHLSSLTSLMNTKVEATHS